MRARLSALAEEASTPELLDVSWFADIRAAQGAASGMTPPLRAALTVATADRAREAHHQMLRDAEQAAHRRALAERERLAALARERQAREEEEGRLREARRAEGRAATRRVAIRWAIASVVLSGITQLWAGSGASPGNGGGFAELILWASVFGAIVVAMTWDRARHANHPVDAESVWNSAAVGFVIAGLIAVVWFTAKGGPTTGDWFVGPAGAALAVGLVLYVRPARP